MQTNEQILSRMSEDLVLRGLATGTQQRYLSNARKFLAWANLPAETLGEEGIRKYLSFLIGKKLSASTINCYNESLRFLFAVTLNRNLNYRQIPLQKQVRSLSEILSKEEVASIFDFASNLRDKAVLMTIYGAGLRVSEACNLRIYDIDSESMRIFVRNSKRNKDRFTLLSHANLDVLREYWKCHRPKHPEGWLFLNRGGSGKIHPRAIQYAFMMAVRRSSVTKDVSVHTLRACFATHLLEAGVDIFTIKQLMGHASIQSTTFYLRLAKFDSNLVSPLDALTEEWETALEEVFVDV